MIEPILLPALLIGVFAGILTGLMGSSGVAVVVPGMILLGYSAHQAIGISLAVDMFASIVVTLVYQRHKSVNLREGIWIALTAVLGAQIGSRLSAFVPGAGISGGFGVFTIISAIFFWRFGTQSNLNWLQTSRFTSQLERHAMAASAVIGLVIGAFSGMFGAGGGMMFMFALILLGYDLHHAVGTSTLIMGLTTASGALGHAMIGNLPLLPMIGASLGTILSGSLASRFANQINEQALGRVIAVVFGIMGLFTILSQRI
jgi:uncharacterized membrane protein YfcA